MNPPTTLADLAAHHLAESIVTGALRPGQKLNEAELAERYGVGRGALREAMRRLEGQRLLTRVPNVGVSVVSLDRAMLEELYTVRGALEGLACRLACQAMTAQEISRLHELLDRHERQIEADDGLVYSQSEADLDFHQAIVRGSGNALLVNLLSGELYQLLRMCRYRTSHNRQRTRPALAQHRRIAEAIAQRDGELAELLMRRHVQGAWQGIQAMLDAEPTAEAPSATDPTRQPPP